MKLSIVTINYNNADGLRKTMESVFAQTCKEFEYIVIDGASTDGSVEIIQEYAQKAESQEPRVKSVVWTSEPDTGIYNAMNKGVRKATGEYVLMLNSGDYLVDKHVIKRIMPELAGTDIVQGNNIEECSGKTYRNRGYGKSDIDFFDVMKGHFLHQSSFCKRDLFERYGYFDESYKMSGDTKFFMICLGRNDATFKYVDIDVANYDMSGISAEKKGPWAQLRAEEHARLMKELYSPRLSHFLEANDKKIQLYNQLHTHRWIWNLVMLIAHIHNFFYHNIPTIKRKEIK